MTKEIKLSDFDFNANPSACYYNGTNRIFVNAMYISGNLYELAAKIILESYVIQNIDIYREFFRTKSHNMEVIQKFADNDIVDSFRIIPGFENYLKGHLLIGNYVIHQIKHEPQFKELWKKQKQQPIKIAELLSRFPWKHDQNKITICEALSNKTLDMNILLSKNYKELLKMDDRIHGIASRINKERNALHFQYIQHVKFTPEKLDDFIHVKDFAIAIKKAGELIDNDCELLPDFKKLPMQIFMDYDKQDDI